MEPGRTLPFYRVEKRGADGTRHFVVHTQEPRLVVEFERNTGSGGAQGPPVIRRLCVPNSPIGGYRHINKLMSVALASIETLP